MSGDTHPMQQLMVCLLISFTATLGAMDFHLFQSMQERQPIAK
jgi:hypothetical protein